MITTFDSSETVYKLRPYRGRESGIFFLLFGPKHSLIKGLFLPCSDAEIEGTSPLIIFAPTVKVSVNRRLHLNAVGSLSYFSGSSILQSPSSFTVSYARSASTPPSRTPLIASESHSHETTLEMAANGGSVSTGYTIPLTRALTMQSGASKPLLTGELNLFLKADLRLARGLVFTCATFVGTGGLHLHLG